MLAFLTEMKAIKGKENELELAMLQLATQVRASEPGNVLYELTRSEHGDLMIWEIFEDERAAQAHLDSLYFKATHEIVSSMLDSPPHIVSHELLTTNNS